MPYVEITGWREGFQKVSCTRLLQQSAGLSLSAAKAYTDLVLDGGKAAVSVAHLNAATRLANELTRRGAVAHVRDGEADV